MKYRKFGGIGLEVSELIFGRGAVGGLLIDADDDTRRKAIRIALDAGVNCIDTAASYGQGRAEKALDGLLKEIPPKEIPPEEIPTAQRPYISSKMACDPKAVDFAGQAERSLAQSLERQARESRGNNRPLGIRATLRPSLVFV